MSEVASLITLIAYAFAFYEVASTSHLYFYATQKSGSKIMKALVWVFVAFIFFILFRAFSVYTITLNPSFHSIFNCFGAIPPFFVGVAMWRFKKISLQNDKINLQEVKDEMDRKS